jgi:mannosyl-3-phosphoglycerate phosphatase family protein
MRPQPIIFTDLDGTLLDHETYAFTAALPALQLVREKGIPLVFCSSKTRAEIEYWRERLENRHPFIPENGGGIFIPRSYFSEDNVGAVWSKTEVINGYSVLVLGTPYPVLRGRLEKLQDKGFKVRGFGDMSAAEVAGVTGLNLKGARLAKRREFDEPFIFSGDQARLSTLVASIEETGFRYAEGRFCHLLGDSDKGKAVDILTNLYQRKFGEIVTIALGDSPVDFSMLEKVDHPVLVRNYKGEHDRRIALPNLIKVEGIGPKGWNKAVPALIEGR